MPEIFTVSQPLVLHLNVTASFEFMFTLFAEKLSIEQFELLLLLFT